MRDSGHWASGSTRMRRNRRALGLAAGALFASIYGWLCVGLCACLCAWLCASLAGCGGPSGSAMVLLRYRFVDGRGCAESGARQLVITAEDKAVIDCGAAGCTVSCADDEASGVELVVPSSGATLDVAAISAQLDTLYRGRIELGSPPPTSVTVTLDFVGGP